MERSPYDLVQVECGDGEVRMIAPFQELRDSGAHSLHHHGIQRVSVPLRRLGLEIRRQGRNCTTQTAREESRQGATKTSEDLLKQGLPIPSQKLEGDTVKIPLLLLVVQGRPNPHHAKRCDFCPLVERLEFPVSQAHLVFEIQAGNTDQLLVSH